jgi:hypothetical protein
VYPDKEVPNKTVHQLVTEFCNTGSVCDKFSSSDKTAEITAIPISSSALAATMGYDCKNSILSLVLLFLHEGVHLE